MMNFEGEKMTEDIARKKYEEYLEAGLKMVPPFKGYGMKFVQFAMDEPEMYRYLFMQSTELPYTEFIEKQMQMEKILPYIESSLELNETDAKWLFQNMALYTYGMGSMLATGTCVMSEEEIGINLGGVCRGLLMQLRAPKDSRIAMIPTEEAVQIGNLEEYVKGKKNVIIGYNENREMYQIRLDAILYFEAVGENVFAYTKNNVYGIKQRLYQVEEKTDAFSFIRASKSLLVNQKKIISLSPEEGGRGMIQLTNGEHVLVSRSYFKSVSESLKNPV